MKNVKSVPVLVILLAFVLLIVSFASAVLFEPEETGADQTKEEQKETGAENKNPEKNAKEESKEPYDYDLSEYLTLGEISPVKANFDDPEECSEEDVDDAVFQILLNYATEKKEGAKAELYNRVTVDLEVLQNGKAIDELGKKDYQIVIGQHTDSDEDLVLGGALVGARVGDQRKKDYTYPEELDGSELAGKKVRFSATVKKIEKHTIPELIDDTVADFTSNAFSTVKEFRESVKNDILQERKMAKAQAVWLAIKEDAKVKKFPERELQDALAMYRQNYESLAARFNLSLEQLVTVYLESDMKTFEADAKKYAEEKVTNDMIMTQLVRLQNITLTDEEYQAGARDYFEKEEGDFGSFEEFVEFYTEENLRRNLLWDKALKTVEDNAVRTK